MPQVFLQMILLIWLAMADIMSNPYGCNKFYDVKLADELELNIWRCSLAIQNQSSDSIPTTTEEERREVQETLWRLIQPKHTLGKKFQKL